MEIDKELEESEIRIRERISKVIAWEMKDAREHIRKELIGRVVSVQRAARRRAAELEASQIIYTAIPAGKSDKKTGKGDKKSLADYLHRHSSG